MSLPSTTDSTTYIKNSFPFVNKLQESPIFDTLTNKLSKSLNTIFPIVMQTISERLE